jgi:hypothetical protein
MDENADEVKGHVVGNSGISIREVVNILGISCGVVERLLKRQTIYNVELGGLVSTSPTCSPDLAACDFLSSQQLKMALNGRIPNDATVFQEKSLTQLSSFKHCL